VYYVKTPKAPKTVLGPKKSGRDQGIEKGSQVVGKVDEKWKGGEVEQKVGISCKKLKNA